MAKDVEKLYQERLKRYVVAMRNEKPDMIPIRPFENRIPPGSSVMNLVFGLDNFGGRYEVNF